MANNWYSIINDESLEQGDILEGVSVLKPTTEFLTGQTKDIEATSHNAIILTQSCDLNNAKTPWVQVASLHKLSDMQEEYEVFKHKKTLETIRRGYEHKFHMLNKCEIFGHECEICVVDFRDVFTIPFQYVSDFVKTSGVRRRLNSPYKEHLSQAYAKFYMRVGLPNDIPSFR